MQENSFSYEAAEQVLIIHMPKEVDHHNCKTLKMETDMILEEHYVNRIVFDFGRTQFMDSSGLGVLFQRYREMNTMGGTIGYYGASPRIRRILAIGGLEKRICSYENKESAVGK